MAFFASHCRNLRLLKIQPHPVVKSWMGFALKAVWKRRRLILYVVGVGALGYAYTKPHWGFEVVERYEPEHRSILRGCFAKYAGSRFCTEPVNRMQSASSPMLSHICQNARRIVWFAGDAFLQCPATNDFEAFLMFLSIIWIRILYPIRVPD